MVRQVLVRHRVVEHDLDRQQLGRQVVVRHVLVFGRVERAMTARSSCAAASAGRVWLVLAGMAAAGATLQLAVLASAPAAGAWQVGLPVAVVVLVLLAGFAATEVAVVHIPTGRNTFTLTLSEIPLVVGLFLLGPVALVLVRVLGALLPLAVRNRGARASWSSTSPGTAVEASHRGADLARVRRPDGELSPTTWLAVRVAVRGRRPARDGC